MRLRNESLKKEPEILSKRNGYGTASGCIAAVWLAILLWQPANAADSFRPRIDSHTDSVGGSVVATIMINDEPAVTLKTISGGHGPEVRSQMVVDRLQTLVANGLAPGEIAAQRVSGRTWAITARHENLLLVTPQEAAAHHSGSASLARSWAAGIRRLLSEPALTFSPSSLTIPYGETRTVHVGGAALASDITAQDADPHISQAKFDPATRTLTVQGVATGRDTVGLLAGAAASALPVVVMKYAAQVSSSVTITVTGSPAVPDSLVGQAVYTGLAEAIDAEPGAQVHLGDTPKPTAVSVGGHETISIPLHIAGDGLLPVETSVAITVQNSPINLAPATALFYSNNPEQVKQGQTLFSGRLQPQRPVRLDYHHQNMSGSPLIFHADLINDGSTPASVHVISGLALPGADTVQVGRRAGASFLTALDSDTGLVLDIPPHARVPLVTQRFATGLTVSGIVQLQQIAGPADTVSLEVSADGDQAALVSPVGRVILAALPDSRSASPLPDQPSDYGNGVPLPPASPFVFGTPQITLTGAYAVGGKWAYVRIGHREALKDATGKFTLWGNYGADYEIDLTLTNPTTQSKPIAILFAPEAGLAAGVFRVDGGAIQEFDPTPPPKELQIAKYTLAPGETRKVHIETIPLNGSSYPASIIAHAL